MAGVILKGGGSHPAAQAEGLWAGGGGEPRSLSCGAPVRGHASPAIAWTSRSRKLRPSI
jgi:hypothetical protein